MIARPDPKLGGGLRTARSGVSIWSPRADNSSLAANLRADARTAALRAARSHDLDDGALTVPELVDLYGRSGFDVLAITDHVVRADDPARRIRSTVVAATYDEYLAEIEAEPSVRPRGTACSSFPGSS